MYGYIISNSNIKMNEIFQCIQVGSYYFYYNPLPVFENDHIFKEINDVFVLLDGVIINKDELMKEYSSDDWPYVIKSMISDYGKDVAGKLRGSFSGVLYFIDQDELIVFTDQLGSKMLLMYNSKGSIMIASHISLIWDAKKRIKDIKSLSINTDSMYELLATGSILEDKTIFQEVRRITAGRRWTINSLGESAEERYHLFRNLPEHKISLDDCIEKADVLFRNAVDRIFRKNNEYGYSHECDLSGGIDSRMAAWVAHDLGYENILNLCYSVKGSIDNKVSKKIASDLGNSYYFLPMDEHIVYDDIDDRVMLSNGQIHYLTSTGGYRSIKELSNKKIGLCCTGLLGEAQKGNWIEGTKHTKPKYTSNRMSAFFEFNPELGSSNEYDNYEQMSLYEFGLKAVFPSILVRQQQVEVLSPLIDTDYLEFVFKIPLKWRIDNKFIQEYMCKKYPDAAKYVWQTTRMPVDNFRGGGYIFLKSLGTLKEIPSGLLINY